jgi:uncharacterized circularly permuted ATP-grasp superfamily protein/uncharacterized alpha-E superfamily protein
MSEASATAKPPAPRESLARGYTPPSGVFDEMRAANGAIRPHWHGLIQELDALGPGELRQREETARRIIHEQGITYNVYGDPAGRERPWQLDLIPFVLDGAEWSKLEAALIQRATLFERILADCYGPQQLIRAGWMPPALLFGQPDFLRPIHGIKPPGGIFLHFYAADVARSPDGRWWVLSDRTQIPTGSGYALANRLVSSRVLPEAFRNCGVQRIAGYFRQLQQTLGGLASRRTEEPRVVLLTPGPFNETYFEQAYLARYLGYTLVEGQDLTVRDQRVYLKTLSGLEPVDVILRRVDDDFCDPLELRSDSMLGVPGLVDALRAGHVAVANAPGTGLLQSPAFMSFLPGLCRQVLGEELRIPSVATWWCGQKPAEKYVLDKLAQLEVRPAFRLRQPLPMLTDEERRERIRFAPHLWAAQERVPLSTVPYWEGDALVPRAAALRVYLVAKPGGGYVAMPGGLTRLGGSNTTGNVTMQRGGASKDTWVLSGGPVEEISLLHPAGKTVELRRVGNNLPSRLADNFFWLGRYAERADATARLLRSALLRFTQESLITAAPLLQPLLDTLKRQGQIPAKRGKTAEAIEALLVGAVYDPKEPASLRSLTERVEQLAMQVRDRTSNDVWRALSSLMPAVTRDENAPPPMAAHAIVSINQLILQVAAFHGMARENMTRAQSWRFLDMGQRIERAIYLCTFLDEALRSPHIENPSVLETVLEAADSTLTYRSRYNLLPNLTATFDLVLLDDTNPRSLLFQLLQLVKHFDRLPREKQSALPSPGERILLELVTRVRLLDPRELAFAEDGREETDTARVIRESLHDLPRLAEAIAVSYFAHSTISRASA